jgi:hypothetical protein
LLNYALLEDNSVVYQEYLRNKKQTVECDLYMRWSFIFLCFIGFDVFVCQFEKGAVVAIIWNSLKILPVWLFYPLIALLSISLLLSFIGSIFYIRYFARKYYFSSSRLFQEIEAKLMPLDDDNGDESIEVVKNIEKKS